MLLTEYRLRSVDHKRKEHMSTEGATGSQPPGTELEAEFVKSNFYRVVHADGAFGGITPSGQIRMAIFSEAQRFPHTITYDISSGRPQEIGRHPESGSHPPPVTRELEVDIAMNLPVARVIHQWLGDKITQVENLTGQMRQATEGERDMIDGDTSHIPTA